jgi:hypothetical protein
MVSLGKKYRYESNTRTIVKGDVTGEINYYENQYTSVTNGRKVFLTAT